jgi:GDP-mannose 4,6-dehydratase
MESALTNCRLCKKTTLVDVIDLGQQVITSRFPILGDNSTPSTTIVLVQCADCGLVQLKHTVKNSELYEYEYGYRSGISNTMRAHLAEYNNKLQLLSGVKEGDSVLDIGSNDSTFLRFYPSNIRRIGIDPTGKQFVAYYKDDVELVPTYFTKSAVQEALGDSIRFKCVSSISMFYDLPDPVQFARDIYDVLDDNGIWTLEQSYILTMLKRNSIDTICHEHLEYYAIRQIRDILAKANFKIISIDLNDCNGGSMRVFAAKQHSSHSGQTEVLEKLLSEESAYGVNNLKCYRDFENRCKREADTLVGFIDSMNASGVETWIYGASTKGNCLLQYADIGPSRVKYAVERNLAKVGKMTSTGIEIISEDTMRISPPAFLLVLPWHFRDEIIQREDAFLSAGGQLIFPFPHFEIVSKKKRALITGWSGQISQYVRKDLEKDYELYGLGEGVKGEKCFSRDSLELALGSVKPSVVVHLAGISNSEQSKQNVVKTLETNGLMCAKICEFIHKNSLNTSLVNASSSELYKGHVTRLIEEDDTYYNHVHPYSIGKLMSHTTVQYFRNEYKLPFSNAILFMTESRLRGPEFLMPKVINHARQWKESHDILSLGSLDSYRNINHAEDIASAIRTMINQPTGDDYLVCGEENYTVLDIVKKVYSLFGIVLEGTDTLTDSTTKLPVIKIHQGFRNTTTNINGHATKLRSLGWSPKYTLDSILLDLI